MNDNTAWFTLIKANLVSLVLLAFAIGFVVYSNRMVRPVIEVSERTLNRIKLAFRAGFTIVLGLLIIFLIIPLAIDTISLMRKGVSWSNMAHIEGKVKTSNPFPFGLWPASQSFCFADDASVFYRLRLSTTLVRKGRVYEIYYLPRSRVVLRISRMSNRERVDSSG